MVVVFVDNDVVVIVVVVVDVVFVVVDVLNVDMGWWVCKVIVM